MHPARQRQKRAAGTTGMGGGHVAHVGVLAVKVYGLRVQRSTGCSNWSCAVM